MDDYGSIHKNNIIEIKYMWQVWSILYQPKLSQNRLENIRITYMKPNCQVNDYGAIHLAEFDLKTHGEVWTTMVQSTKQKWLGEWLWFNSPNIIQFKNTWESVDDYGSVHKTNIICKKIHVTSMVNPVPTIHSKKLETYHKNNMAKRKLKTG